MFPRLFERDSWLLGLAITPVRMAILNTNFIAARYLCNCNWRGDNSNWNLPVICIILRQRLFHFGLGNDTDRTCHATGFGAALLVAEILHGVWPKLLRWYLVIAVDVNATLFFFFSSCN